jgi:probable rRNA maturation factor
MVGLRASEALNTDYRKRKKPTNILTFPYQGPPELHADLVLCLPLCRAEANAQGKPLDHHLAHLLVHGVLHACGLDHVQAPEAAQMEALETSILKRFRIPDPYQPAAQHETVAP